ncbi:hypothetical protein ACTFIZ_002254 [Dictyostelium cf. discoideum]
MFQYINIEMLINNNNNNNVNNNNRNNILKVSKLKCPAHFEYCGRVQPASGKDKDRIYFKCKVLDCQFPNGSIQILSTKLSPLLSSKFFNFDDNEIKKHQNYQHYDEDYQLKNTIENLLKST